jgi:5'-deoxynucleotidase YfbR-like HD superfamily hydrolase
MLCSDVNDWCDMVMNDPERVAQCLKRIGRFGGQHTTATVLRHSLEVSARAPTIELRLWGLVHDAHEILTGDCTRQFKSESLTQVQLQLDQVLCDRLELPRSVLEDIRPIDAAVGNEERIQWDWMQWSTPGRVSNFIDEWIYLRYQWRVSQHE